MAQTGIAAEPGNVGIAERIGTVEKLDSSVAFAASSDIAADSEIAESVATVNPALQIFRQSPSRVGPQRLD